MPFFMYLSGVVMYYTYTPMKHLSKYCSYVSEKFFRLAPGFFLFAVIILMGKLYFSNYFHVDNIPQGLTQGLLDILIRPTQSAARSLWYIYVLFEFYLVFPIVLFFAKQRAIILIVAGIFLYFIPSTNFMALNSFCKYFLFFALGIYSVSHYAEYKSFLSSHSFLFVIVFLFSFVSLFFENENLSKLIIGLSSLPALHLLASSKLFSRSNQLSLFGKYTYVIYLMNTILIGIAKGVFLNFASWGGIDFLLMSPILLISGLYGPIILKRNFLSKSKILHAITT